MGLGGFLGSGGAALLRKLDPETAHGLAIAALRNGLVPSGSVPQDERLKIRLFDLEFPNPLGLAAGFDKNAEVPNALLRLGFGFVEVGSLTPLRQEGNPKPRIFRLPEVSGVINRLGFNNCGHDEAARNLSRRRQKGIIGINVGANKDSIDRSADYVAGIRRFIRFASYFSVNVSSPNTPGLRDLQARGSLEDLMARVIEARDAAQREADRSPPVFLKIAPDLSEEGLDDIALVVSRCRVDGLVVSNTTLSRADIQSPWRAEAGGLSGRPLFARSTLVLAKMRQRLGPDLPIIGVGGIMNGADAFEKIAAGATLLQIYTGFIYGGPRLPERLLAELLALLEKNGYPSITALSGARTLDWAAQIIPDL